MTDINQFNEIRPYGDKEFKTVLQDIVKEVGFLKFLKYFYPDIPTEQIVEMLLKLNTTYEFQKLVLEKMVDKIIAHSTTSFTYSGFFENVKKDDNYLFITNHRDIVLDSVLINKILMSNEYETMEVAMGSNLLILKWITDLVKINKTFIVKRDVPVKDMYRYSLMLSKYMRYTLTEKKNSVWIAQREGRTKNGDDRTQISLLKMLNMSGEGDIVQNLKDLKIVPVSISYQYEPCDLEKVRERYNKMQDKNFKKTKMDDLMSMGKGMEKQKGAVHFAFGKPLNEELDKLKSIKKRADQFAEVAKIMDKKIHTLYKLTPENYIAAQKFYGISDYNDKFTQENVQKFEAYQNKILSQIDGSREITDKMFLEIYANPVKNKMSYE